MKIFYGDIAPTASISVTTEESTFEKEKLIDNSPSNKYRSTAITLQKLIFDFTSAVTITGTAYFGTNIVSGDTTFNFRAGAGTPPSTETDALEKAAKGYLDGFSYNYRYFSQEIVKASGTYIEEGKIMLCTGVFDLTTARQENWGFINSKVAIFDKKAGQYGQIFKTFRYIAQQYEFEFESMGDTQKELFDETIRVEPYVALYDDVKDEIFFGTMEFGKALGMGNNLWNMTANFLEAK